MAHLRYDLSTQQPIPIIQQGEHETISKHMLASIILKMASTSTVASCQNFCLVHVGEVVR